MIIRRRTIGDLYLSSSIVFIFLAFLYFGLELSVGFGTFFLVIAILIALFGMKTKRQMMELEKSTVSINKRLPNKKSSKKKK